MNNNLAFVLIAFGVVLLFQVFALISLMLNVSEIEERDVKLPAIEKRLSERIEASVSRLEAKLYRLTEAMTATEAAEHCSKCGQATGKMIEQDPPLVRALKNAVERSKK